jgi:hypothetical protein
MSRLGAPKTIAVAASFFLTMLPLAFAAAPADVDASLLLTKSETNYLLGCGGCHGESGRSNSKLVPDLKDSVGYYLATPAGRAYLVRLPNVSFYSASDAELADILNYAIFTIGGAGAPANAKRYTATEVSRLRKTPLTEVSLVGYRAQLVSELIEKYGAPASMRFYSDQYLQQP